MLPAINLPWCTNDVFSLSHIVYIFAIQVDLLAKAYNVCDSVFVHFFKYQFSECVFENQRECILYACVCDNGHYMKKICKFPSDLF